MSSPQKKLDLGMIGHGDLLAQVDREFNQVCENIADPNTPAEAVRTITIKLKIKADKKRNMAALAYMVKSELPASEPGKQLVFVAADPEDGALAFFPMDIRQGELQLEPTVTEIRPVSGQQNTAAPAFAPPHPGAS